MFDGVVPTDSSFSMSGHQESVGAHVDAHSQHVVFDLVSFCGPFRHRPLRHYEGPIILTHGPKASSVVAFLVSFCLRVVGSRARTRSWWSNGFGPKGNAADGGRSGGRLVWPQSTA